MMKSMKVAFHLLLLLVIVAVPVIALGQSGPPEFVSLTDFEGLEELGNSDQISGFFNNLYKICVGLAAAIAVFQIIIAGITYMGGDSFTEKKAAREKITSAVLGLLLVLSPVIVFSIINPSILELKLDLSKVQPQQRENPTSPNQDKTAEAICRGYTESSYVPVPQGQSCSDVKGGGWAHVPDCCVGNPQQGYQCCAKDKNYVAPQPGKFDGPYAFSIAYRDTDDFGNACLAYEDRGGFESQTVCSATFSDTTKMLQQRNQPFAVGRLCTEAAQHTPTPSGTWNSIRTLPPCN